MKRYLLSLMPHKLHDDAIFIADAHYQLGVREDFYDFLGKLASAEIETTQLIMIGDMFDLLVGEIDYTIQQNQKVIDLLNQLSHKMQILYFEGNHDFNLRKIFPNIQIIPRHKQPLICHYHDKHIALSHGDLYQGWRYEIYTRLIRFTPLLWILNFIDRHKENIISKTILQSQSHKTMCNSITHFEQKIKKKSKRYDIASNRFDFICEGHYHIDKTFHFDSCEYKIFASYACNSRYFVMHFTKGVVFTPHKG